MTAPKLREVTACPGPSAPTYTCIGTRGLRCPLEAAADVVVVDAELPGEEDADAASGLDLLSYYTGWGKPVIALRAQADALRLFAEEPVRTIEWPPETGALVGSIERAMNWSWAPRTSRPSRNDFR